MIRWCEPLRDVLPMSGLAGTLLRLGPGALAVLLSACGVSSGSLHGPPAAREGASAGPGLAALPYAEADTALPETLAASDAHAISAAAANAISFAAPSPGATWENAETGSSGTLTALAAPVKLDGVPCRAFDAMVTSLRGIHLYVATVCQGARGAWLRSVRDPDGAPR